MSTYKPRILLVDLFNVFYQHYKINKAINFNGDPIGGFIGTLNQIRKLVDTFNPQKVFIVIDGPNAGLRRRNLFPEYKGKRNRKKRVSVIKLDENDKIEIDDEQIQLQALYNALKLLPVQILLVPNFEADDVIAYLVKKNTEFSYIISSNDKDYLQLVNDDVSMWANQKKKLYTPKEVKEEFLVSSNNLIYLRSIEGDKSDKLAGIKGIGDSTLIKLLPQITTTDFNSFDEFWENIDNLPESKLKTLNNLKDNKGQAHLMYRLMKLDNTVLNLKGIEFLQEQLEEQQNKSYSKITFKAYCVKEKLESNIKNFEFWIRPFAFLRHDIKLTI